MKILLAGGGTGGHLVPGIALAEAARARGDEILFVTAGRAVEERILGNLPKTALALERGEGAPSFLAIAARLPGAIRAAKKVILQFKPDVLLGLGGLVSLPAALAARLSRVPVGLLEINAVPGKATALLAPLASRIFVASELGLAQFHKKGLLTGMPLRSGFLQSPERAASRTKFGLDPSRKTILILGGSQGAAAVNRAVAAILGEIESMGAQILWIAGPGKDGAIRAAVAERPKLKISIHNYLDDTPSAYAAADVAICRSGAATVFELAATGLPAIAIPYPYHRDQQQLRNAQLLGEGVLILEEKELSPARLAEGVRSILEHSARRAAMSDACRRRARPKASDDILDSLASLAAARKIKI